MHVHPGLTRGLRTFPRFEQLSASIGLVKLNTWFGPHAAIRKLLNRQIPKMINFILKIKYAYDSCMVQCIFHYFWRVHLYNGIQRLQRILKELGFRKFFRYTCSWRILHQDYCIWRLYKDDVKLKISLFKCVVWKNSITYGIRMGEYIFHCILHNLLCNGIRWLHCMELGFDCRMFFLRKRQRCILHLDRCIWQL